MLNDQNIIRGGAPSSIEKVKQHCLAFLGNNFTRKKVNADLKKKLSEEKFTLITQNCIGGVFYHDCGRQFLSPTINMSFDGPDFIHFLSDMKKYLGSDLVEFKTELVPYPVGHIEDIEVRFNHYNSFADAKQKWMERRERIVFDNIFVIATDRDGMGDPNIMEQFDSIPYPKIMYTTKEYNQYDWVVPMKRFKNHHQVGILTGFCNLKGQRFYEEVVDLPEWINSHGAVLNKM